MLEVAWGFALLGIRSFRQLYSWLDNLKQVHLLDRRFFTWRSNRYINPDDRQLQPPYKRDPYFRARPPGAPEGCWVMKVFRTAGSGSATDEHLMSEAGREELTRREETYYRQAKQYCSRMLSR